MTTSSSGALKIVGSVLAVSAAIGFLLYRSTAEGAEYYKHVDEVTANPTAWQGKRLQVHGNVADHSILQVPGTLEYRFTIESREPRKHAVIAAHYTGIVPDTFKSGAEVVASGSLGADGGLEVRKDGIMAKCPSKYDASKAAPKPLAGGPKAAEKRAGI